MKETTTTAIRARINIIHLFSYFIIGRWNKKFSSYVYGIAGMGKKTGIISLFFGAFLLMGAYPAGPHTGDPPLEKRIALALAEAGFENVETVIKNNRLVIACENKIFRYDIEAMREVFKITGSLIERGMEVTYIAKEDNIPAAAVDVMGDECISYSKGELGGKEFAQRMRISFTPGNGAQELNEAESINSSYGNFDLSFRPGLTFQFGPYTEPVMYQANLIAEVSTGLWKGMTATYELVIPVKNDFGSRYDSVRSGRILLNQLFEFTEGGFVSLSGGVFTQNRYGTDVEIKKYFLNGNLSVTLNAGYTGYVSFSGFEKIHYTKDFIFTGSAGIDYRFEEYDLTVGVAAGKYLLGDKSLRVEVSRYFGEVEIGFFAVRSTEGINNGGINIAVPLFPSRSLTKGLVKIKAADKFNTSYAVKSNAYDLIGLRYNTGHRINGVFKNYAPSYIKNNF